MAGAADTAPVAGGYRLEDQVGFFLRRAGQRHAAIFADRITDQLTPTQWAALVKLVEFDSLSQNLLGRETAMDAATIKGVVDRLLKRGFVATAPDPGMAAACVYRSPARAVLRWRVVLPRQRRSPPTR